MKAAMFRSKIKKKRGIRKEVKKMINKVGQIMLYVNDQDAALRFWTEKVGLTIVSEEDNGQGMR